MGKEGEKEILAEIVTITSVGVTSTGSGAFTICTCGGP